MRKGFQTSRKKVNTPKKYDTLTYFLVNFCEIKRLQVGKKEVHHLCHMESEQRNNLKKWG